MNKFPIRIILSDIRSAQNVGAILRTADAINAELVYACGYTPYPLLPKDDRPAHIASSNTNSISKTALGAETTMLIRHCFDTTAAINEAKAEGFTIIVLEQAENSLMLYEYVPTGPIAIVLGNEVTGILPKSIAQADTILELPMLGAKESLNVSVAAGVALYHLRFGNRSR